MTGEGTTHHTRRRVLGLVAAVISSALLIPLVGTPAAAEAVDVVDDEVTVARGAVVDVDVLANDHLGDAPGLVTIEVSSPPAVGTAEVVAPFIRYTPGVAVPVGAVTFEYTVRVDGEIEGSAVVTATVENAPPVAQTDVASVVSARGVMVDIDVLANDTDPDGGELAVSAVGDPEHGSITLVGDVVTYNPVNDYVGSDSVTYTVVDGQGGSAQGLVELTVSDATSPMVIREDTRKAVAGTRKYFRVLSNDDSGGRGPLTIVKVTAPASGATVSVAKDAQRVVYRAKKSFAGRDTFTYKVRDRRGNKATATVVVTVKPIINIKVSGPLTRRSVPFSYRPGCPVPPRLLRRVTMNYRSFSGEIRRGELIVRKKAVKDLSYVFRRAFKDGFRVQKMKPIDAYYKGGRRSPTASDRAAMAAGNTSAFNCRSVVGNPTKRSAHSYGIAIDINTFQNPYVVGSTFYPSKAGSYLRRVPCRKGMICPGGPIARGMKARGWPWGARWSNPDYQHFSATGG